LAAVTDPIGEEPVGFVSLAEAAKRAGCSVRTVLRWVEQGLVETASHPTNRRRRLVSLADLEHMTRHRTNPEEEAAAREAREAADRAAIVTTVRGVYQQAALAGEGIGFRLHELTDEQLAASPVAYRLSLLVGAVRGDASKPPEDLQDALDEVLQALYFDPVTLRTDVPDAFWSDSLIGRHLARAKLLLHPPADLVSLNQIASIVGLPRDHVANIVQALQVERFFDPDEQRWFYPRAVIDAIRTWDVRRATTSAMGGGRVEKVSTELPPLERTIQASSATENRRDLRVVRKTYHKLHFSDAPTLRRRGR
jgi:hypothetical protein